MARNFSVEIAVTRSTATYYRFDGPLSEVSYYTDSVADFTEYLNSAMTHYRSMLRYESEVIGVSILVRTHGYHQVIDLSINEDGIIIMQEN